jgi:hypothetical protein
MSSKYEDSLTTFRVAAKAKLTLILEFDIRADDSFDQARELGHTAIESWIKKRLTGEYRDDGNNWPNPTGRLGRLEVVGIQGEWKPPEDEKKEGGD